MRNCNYYLVTTIPIFVFQHPYVTPQPQEMNLFQLFNVTGALLTKLSKICLMHCHMKLLLSSHIHQPHTRNHLSVPLRSCYPKHSDSTTALILFYKFWQRCYTCLVYNIMQPLFAIHYYLLAPHYPFVIPHSHKLTHYSANTFGRLLTKLALYFLYKYPNVIQHPFTIGIPHHPHENPHPPNIIHPQL